MEEIVPSEDNKRRRGVLRGCSVYHVERVKRNCAMTYEFHSVLTDPMKQFDHEK